MIIEGKPAGRVGFWVKHLQRTDTNEEVYIRSVRGTLAQDLEGALREMEAVASGSRCQGNFMYQANINPRIGEHLTPEQWRQAVDTLEANLGLTDHQRVVIEHVKDGRQHYHVIWNRVDVDTMRVRDMGGNYYTHERTARQLEQEFGLERAPRVHGEREGERISKRTDMWEYDRGHDSGQSPKQIKAELTTLWNASPNGKVFVEALERYGYILAKGDRRDFCIIDRAGDEHSLARRLDGVTAKQLKASLSFVDRDNLPTVEQAKELYAQRQAERARKGPERKEPEHKTLHSDDRRPDSSRDTSRADHDAEARREDAPRPEQSRAKGNDGATATPKAARAGIKVADAGAKVIGTLADFLADLLTAFVAPPEPKRTMFEQLDDDPGERVAAIRAERRADAALENIADDLKRGNTVKAEDIRNLSPADLENLRDTGDAGLLAMVKRLEEERARDRDPGRGRER